MYTCFLRLFENPVFLCASRITTSVTFISVNNFYHSADITAKTSKVQVNPSRRSTANPPTTIIKPNDVKSRPCKVFSQIVTSFSIAKTNYKLMFVAISVIGGSTES